MSAGQNLTRAASAQDAAYSPLLRAPGQSRPGEADPARMAGRLPVTNLADSRTVVRCLRTMNLCRIEPMARML
jgi:hypothetical protein